MQRNYGLIEKKRRKRKKEKEKRTPLRPLHAGPAKRGPRLRTEQAPRPSRCPNDNRIITPPSHHPDLPENNDSPSLEPPPDTGSSLPTPGHHRRDHDHDHDLARACAFAVAHRCCYQLEHRANFAKIISQMHKTTARDVCLRRAKCCVDKSAQQPRDRVGCVGCSRGSAGTHVGLLLGDASVQPTELLLPGVSLVQGLGRGQHVGRDLFVGDAWVCCLEDLDDEIDGGYPFHRVRRRIHCRWVRVVWCGCVVGEEEGRMRLAAFHGREVTWWVLVAARATEMGRGSRR
ncbi:hypothetical protein B0T19DRAFT_99061 [Cercophora scortea]|uniref:Uncharacterized protein n=1 Tax=Cercophora scortea TaxID=314031 RepID=A0AAE0IVW4_9PEZI|nr:hypothetical protein B0T19DRAFT_99061 [Cercophora scortea]